MNRKSYLVLFVLLMALAAAGLYARQRAKTAALAANCDTPAPPPPQTAPPPNLPGFVLEPGCGTGVEAPTASKTSTASKTPEASKAPTTLPAGKTGKAK